MSPWRPNLVVYGPDHRPFTVAYQELPPMLLALAQRQQRQIAAEHRQIAAQQREIDALRRQQGEIGQLAREVAALRHAAAR